ncbi:MAG: phytanoyl-CoA dioxygenase family protein [Verrucomicrobia bacterium]|nr:phytanoyl-CoA dioxygenase family protein [Verrucomicrobiota bacterium]
MSLTATERRQFMDEGYVVKSAVFSASDLRPIKDAINEIVDQGAAELHAAGKLAETFADAPFESRLARIRAANPEAGDSIYRRLTGKGGGGYSGPAMLGMYRHEPLVSCIQSLIGDTIIGASVYRIRPKMPGFIRGEVPWHQDSGYLLTHCDKFLIVTCWIPLIDANEENGCLYVLPRAHRNGVMPHHTGGHGGFLEILPDDLPDPHGIPVPMKAGDVLFMTNLTPHRSLRNRTAETIRWSLDLRYQGADAPTNANELPEDFQPEREPVTMACYPPEADFVIRDPAHPEREIRDPAAFHALRQRFEHAHIDSPGRGWSPLPASRS